jgi:hypothetical protein
MSVTLSTIVCFALNLSLLSGRLTAGGEQDRDLQE